MEKICNCEKRGIRSAPYYDSGVYRCQYCGGVLTDLERVRRIIDCNTPTNERNREKVIESKLQEHIKFGLGKAH